MEQEALAEQEKNGVAALQMNHTLMGQGLDLELAELLRRQKEQQELPHLMQM
jgi:hypothetical protein